MISATEQFNAIVVMFQINAMQTVIEDSGFSEKLVKSIEELNNNPHANSANITTKRDEISDITILTDESDNENYYEPIHAATIITIENPSNNNKIVDISKEFMRKHNLTEEQAILTFPDTEESLKNLRKNKNLGLGIHDSVRRFSSEIRKKPNPTIIYSSFTEIGQTLEIIKRDTNEQNLIPKLSGQHIG